MMMETRLRTSFWIAALVAVLATLPLAAAASEDSVRQFGVVPETLQLPGPGDSLEATPYSESAVWILGHPASTNEMAARCAAASWLELKPDNPLHAGCILEVMRDAGASAAALRFFESTKMFLGGFQELGTVDLGSASAPWFNMGRGEAVFLNGLPSALPIHTAFDVRPEAWQSAPGYPELLRTWPRVFPWPEYARLAGSEMLLDGSQWIALEFPMRECRACPTAAWMPVVFQFGGSGRLVARDVLPPKLD